VEGTPINPSDLGLLIAMADLKTGEETKDSSGRPVVRAEIPEKVIKSLNARVGIPMAVGNEGAGTVVAAGSDPEAQQLLGKVVAIFAGSMYSQYRNVAANQCLVLPPGTTPSEGASSFVNPLTVLGMLETMKEEGFKGLVHTAAASQLGQMLVKVCQADNVPLVNIVRRKDQVDILKRIGAKYVVDSSSPTFQADLVDAIATTGAYLAFDATGGGSLSSYILSAMEAAANRNAKVYSRYGSNVFKQVYVYGGLDTSPTILHRNYGMLWSLKGWLLTPLLQKIGPSRAQALRERVARELKTNFATNYTSEISLLDVARLPVLQKIAQMTTSEKYLINPSRLQSKL